MDSTAPAISTTSTMDSTEPDTPPGLDSTEPDTPPGLDSTEPANTPPGMGPVPPTQFYRSKPPKTPGKTKSTLIKSMNTPISKKTSGYHSYSSQDRPREELNEMLAEEMKLLFVGPIPPRDFLDTVLYDGHDDSKPPEIDLSAFEKVSGAGTEPKMHQQFVEVMTEFDIKGWQFVNSANQRDGLRDRLGPDVPIYGPEAPSGMDKPDFSQMDTFVEFKEKESSDPFEDPKEADGQSTGRRPSFERNSKDAKQIRGQLGSYVAAISGSQFRLRVFAILVFGSFARLMCWDRAGAVVTEKFNYTTEPFLIQFLLKYRSCDAKNRGLDPTVRPLTKPERTIVKDLDCKGDLIKRNSHHREFRMMMIPDRDDDDTEHLFLISYPPRYTSRSPFGRATRPMRAYDMEKKKVVFVKDYWRPEAEDIEKEGEIYRSLEKAKVPYIAPFGVGNDVKKFKTVVQAYARRWGTGKFSGLILYRMSLEKLGDDLAEFKSTEQLVRVIGHAMTAHDAAYFDAKILHRDISVGNILIGEDGDGLLIDWDLCVRITDGPPAARRSQRTGTWQFISAALLRDPTQIQTIEDDRESALHVLSWLALRFSKHDGLTKLATRLKIYDEVDPPQSGGADTGGLAKGNDLGSPEFPNFESIPLNRLLRELRKAFSFRYGEHYSADEIQEGKDIIAAGSFGPTDLHLADAYRYGSAMEALATRNWLVKVFNKHLESDNWPRYDDPADPNAITPTTSSSKKRASSQVKLDERPRGSNSRRKL